MDESAAPEKTAPAPAKAKETEKADAADKAHKADKADKPTGPASPLPVPAYADPGRFPSVQRDLSFLLDKDVVFGQIKAAVQALRITELSDFRLIDLYHGPNLPQDKLSLTVRLVFADPSHTLTQDEVNMLCEKVLEALRSGFAVESR